MARSFDPLSERFRAMLMVRAHILKEARNWFGANGFTEVHGPIIIPAFGDWPNSFEVKFFGEKAYLAKGLQPYANAFVAGLGKIYTIAPAFRAEKLRTGRHLSEYWRIEVAQRSELDDIIQAQEELVFHICQSLREVASSLSSFNRVLGDITEITTPFPRLTYDEVIDTLQSGGFEVTWGQKLDWNMEKWLSLEFNQPFFITKFPFDTETSFYKSDPERSELSMSVDLLAPEGYGEISSGLELLTEKNAVGEKMAEQNIHPGDERWYMSFLDQSVPHAAFAMGVERLIQWFCKLENIEEAIAFPRLFGSFSR